MLSRDDFNAAVDRQIKEGKAQLIALIDRAQAAAKAKGEREFTVVVPLNTPLAIVHEVIDEVRQLKWTVVIHDGDPRDEKSLGFSSL